MWPWLSRAITLRDVLQHQLLQHEAVDDGLRLQIQQGAAQPMLDPERQQQAAAQHGADGADEQGDPIQIDTLHRLHQIAHHHGADGAPVRPDHRGEAANGRPQGTHVLGAVTAALVEEGQISSPRNRPPTSSGEGWLSRRACSSVTTM